MIKRIIVVAALIYTFAGSAFAAPLPQINAEAACLVEAASLRMLYGKEERKIMYPASTTKIVTLLVALEKGELDSVVTVSENAAQTEGSSMELTTGERYTLRDMLYGLMLLSGNDAAVAIVEHIGGTEQTFAAMMNDKARQLGATGSHFSNSHGLPDRVYHYTTAYDLGLIAARGFNQPGFEQFVSARQEQVETEAGLIRTFENHNRILSIYPGANGVKTGYTDDAGLCVVASAKRNGIQLIAVILNSDTRWEDAAKLMDYGFRMVSYPSS